MGQEIATSHFSRRDFSQFEARLRQETALLREWFADGRLADGEAAAGFELEAWLIDRDARPAPINEAFLARLDSPLVAAELARFNIEINTAPLALRGRALQTMQAGLPRPGAGAGRSQRGSARRRS